MSLSAASPALDAFLSATLSRDQALAIARQHMPPTHQVSFIMRDLGLRTPVDDSCRLAVSLAAMQCSAMGLLKHPGVAAVVSAVVREQLETDEAKLIYRELLKAGTQPEIAE